MWREGDFWWHPTILLTRGGFNAAVFVTETVLSNVSNIRRYKKMDTAGPGYVMEDLVVVPCPQKQTSRFSMFFPSFLFIAVPLVLNPPKIEVFITITSRVLADCSLTLQVFTTIHWNFEITFAVCFHRGNAFTDCALYFLCERRLDSARRSPAKTDGHLWQRMADNHKGS